MLVVISKSTSLLMVVNGTQMEKEVQKQSQTEHLSGEQIQLWEDVANVRSSQDLADLKGEDFFRDHVGQEGRMRGQLALVLSEVTKKGELSMVLERQDKSLSKQETRVETRRIRSSLYSWSSQAIRGLMGLWQKI